MGLIDFYKEMKKLNFIYVFLLEFTRFISLQTSFITFTDKPFHVHNYLEMHIFTNSYLKK
jgi:hypothetical protein